MKEKSKSSSEFFVHEEKLDGSRNLYFGKMHDKIHGHAILDANGNVRYVRESDGRIIADDNMK